MPDLQSVSDKCQGQSAQIMTNPQHENGYIFKGACLNDFDHSYFGSIALKLIPNFVAEHN